MSGLQQPTIISSGELFILNGCTGGELQPMPFFRNKNLRVLSANLDRAYVATEPTIWSSPLGELPPCSVFCFKADLCEPEYCPEFESIEAPIRQIAFGSSHTLVLTTEGVLYSRGVAMYGSTGHGGARDVPEFTEVPALKGREVRFVAAGPFYSIAITAQGDVYSWGKAFYGETGLFSQVEAVPRFSSQVTPFKVTQVSCGHSHVLARTQMQQCISWGENTCGQLGLGQKSKPTYKPQLLSSIPSQIQTVSAGWAHSVAVGTDGRAYSWGLNSHGQLGLGDTTTRLAPHLLHDLINVHEVVACQAARAFTMFRTAQRALMCGQIPPDPAGQPMDFAPHRPGHHDPPGCILAPVPLSLSEEPGCKGMGELSEIVAFDKGAIAFARSAVYKVSPNVAPIQGGTKVCAHVTGLPYEEANVPIQDQLAVQVRLKSHSPNCDLIVKGRVIGKDLVEFETPDASPSPLRALVEQGTTLPVSVRVSIDGGFTWTPDRFAAPPARELEQTLKQLPGEQQRAGYGLSQGPKDIQSGLSEVKGDFEARRKAIKITSQSAAMLWLCKWPTEGPTQVEPGCAPVDGGTEVLIHVALPARMPTDNLTVKFLCTPKKSLNDPELEAKAPMRRDAAEITNPDKETVAKLPLAGVLEVPVIAFLDPGGRGVCCTSPPLDAESVAYYNYSVMVSLDGHNYLPRPLPFQIFDIHVAELQPQLGVLTDATEVRIRTTGFVMSDIFKVRLDFPKDLQWPPKLLPASYDHTTGDIVFHMPALQEAPKEVQGAGGDGEAAEGGAGEAQADRLAGVEVFVELSLDGQNFTEDHMHFCYIGGIRPEALKLLAGPEGAPEEETKPKGKGKEEADVVTLHAGSKIGCVTTGLPACRDFISAVLKAQLCGEDGETLKTLELPAVVETMESEGQSEELITALAPAIPSEKFPDAGGLFLKNFEVSLNGQSFSSCPEIPAMKLEPLPPEPAS
ncbi:unnamed protein product [Effrenium voratum]|uniref:RCC1-like domain-containing protein n=1 Tax=Effrenium voratum TaxID=2562239 RepID=A0AA36NGW9_9DINO|nr:unnamed protein product [Effrenium voratum]CAJ1437515.1 unnamed protein product [Effrenium voratum]